MMKRPTTYALAATALCLLLASCSEKDKAEAGSLMETDPVAPDSTLADLIKEQGDEANYARIVTDSDETILIDFREAQQALSMLFWDVKAEQVTFAPHLKGDWQKGPHSVLIEVSPAEANKLFDKHVDLDLPIDGRASSAIVRRVANEGGIEIAFAFKNSGSQDMVDRTTDKLSRKWKTGSDDSLWMPFSAFAKDQPQTMNIPMGSFSGDGFTISLWIDRNSSLLFVAVREKPEGDPIEGG